MFKVSLAGLRAHKRRLAGTFLAVFLGVAFLAGTLVLSATLSTSIDGFFTRAYAGTDVVIRNAATVGSSVGAQRGPIAAEVAARPSVTRLAIGGTLSLAGVVLALTGVGGGGSAMARAGIGAVLTLVGVVALGPAAARPAGALLGAPVALRGVAGVLARRNAMRNPRRTWGAAAALLIGVGVVTLFTVFAASLQESTVDGVKRAFTGDLAVSASQSGNGAVSPQVAADLGRLPQISAATGVGGGSALVAGRSVQVTVADPTALARVMNLDPVAGSVEHLAAGQFAVAENVARDRAWHTGASVTVGYADGATDTLTLGGIYRANPLLGDYLLPERTWRAHTSPYVDSVVYVALAGGADTGRARQAVTAAVAPYGAPTVRDRQQLIDASANGIGQLLGVVYVMLVLAILIALMGIANTLSLAVHERTRELGVLRAVGATRRQIRSMVRWESAITALFGTLGGLGVGAFLGWVLVRAASGQGISTVVAPPVPLAVVLIGGAVAGLLAGLLPARRAARLRLLQAIAAD